MNSILGRRECSLSMCHEQMKMQCSGSMDVAYTVGDLYENKFAIEIAGVLEYFLKPFITQGYPYRKIKREICIAGESKPVQGHRDLLRKCNFILFTYAA